MTQKFKFKNIFLSVTIVCTTALLSSCTGHSGSVSTLLDDTAQTLQEGNITGAQRLCAELMTRLESKDSVEFSATDCARLSLLFMQLADNVDADANVADAAICLERAQRINSDSVAQYFASLPVEEMRHLEILQRIRLSIDASCDSLWQEIPDEPMGDEPEESNQE